jgi:histidinol-phosphate aminotransferase
MESNMSLSRRSFVKAASVSGIGALTVPLIAARGSEAARESLFEPYGMPEGNPVFAHMERAPWRIANPNALRLDSNENPNGPGKVALDAVRNMFGEAPRYPDVSTSELVQAIARHHKIAPENVMVTCGSGEVLRVAVYAFTSPERSLVTGLPSFEDPVQHAQMTKAPVHAVPVDAALKLDLDGMLAKAPGAGLVFFCNPNNPTTTVHGNTAVKNFIAEVHKREPNAVIMMDEAYHEYVDDPGYATSIPIALQDPNVITVRTFSKVFGMAGLRLGYVIGQPATLQKMRRHTLGNAINVLAAAAGVATIADPAHIEREKQLNKASREFTRKSLESMGFKSAESHGNFLMVNINRDTRAFKDACAKHGVLVGRAFPPLLTYSRISIGTMDEMKKATDVFRQVLSGAAN